MAGASMDQRWASILTTTNSHQQMAKYRPRPRPRPRPPPSVSYQPTTWTHDFVESLKSDDHKDDVYKERRNELDNELKTMIDGEGVEPMALLELVDNIQRLGLGYRFKNDIKQAIDRFVSLGGSDEREDKSLHATALSFRLLRQHGYDVSQDVFKRYKDDNGNFNTCLCNDVKGMLSLLEASYLAFEGENLLDEAKAFTSIHLKSHVEKIDPSLAEQVRHALELPLHRRMMRLEAREYIESYGRRENANQMLLELAVMDFNMVQSVHQRELQDMSRWWKEIGLANKLSFIRDRITESFFASVGLVLEPHFSNCRKGLTQVMVLITTIDDIYDIYGSMEEIEQFTEAVERWSMDAAEKLPDGLKLCFRTLFDIVNEMAYENLKQQGVNTVSHLKKAWADFCKSMLLEAKWYNSKYTPTFKECLDNGLVSSAGIVILIHAYCLISQNITKEELGCFHDRDDLVRHPSIIFRLCNDLASSAADLEGDETTKSIPCYVHETGLLEKFACDHVRDLVDETWKKMNKITQVDDNTPFPRAFVDIILNLGRTIHCIYQHGDAYGAPDYTSRKRVAKLLMVPVSLFRR